MPEIARPSRVIHRSITTSERLAAVSDSAWRLYVLLLVNQDDEGRYPWSPFMVRALVVGTQWSVQDAERFKDELVRTQLVLSKDSVLTVRRGAELNGVPKSGTPSWQTPRIYATDGGTYSVRTEDVLSTDSEPQIGIRLDRIGSRYDIGASLPKKDPEPERKQPKHEPISDAWLTEMQVAFPMLNVAKELADAQNRKQWDDYKDKRLHFKKWLERAVTFLAAPPSRNGHAPARPTAEVRSAADEIQDMQERLAKQRAGYKPPLVSVANMPKTGPSSGKEAD